MSPVILCGTLGPPSLTVDGAPTPRGDLPDAAVAAIRVAYRRLSTASQPVLAAASIFGDRVPVDRLERALGLPNRAVT